MAAKSLPAINPGVSMSRIKSRLLQPALTSNYSVIIAPPGKASFPRQSGDKGLALSFIEKQLGKPVDNELLELSCSEASLPGSSFATIDINNDYMGITQKHAYRRLYDDRADFTFYVTQDSNYYQIRFFEAWMRYIANEQYTQGVSANDKLSSASISRVQYPEFYKSIIQIVKYERDYGTGRASQSPILIYDFVDAFPVSLNSIPVSYESSSLLKVTVSFSYTRYAVDDLSTVAETTVPGRNPNSTGNPDVPPGTTTVQLNGSRGTDIPRTVALQDGRSTLSQIYDSV
jgi:hypothetical protein